MLIELTGNLKNKNQNIIWVFTNNMIMIKKLARVGENVSKIDISIYS